MHGRTRNLHARTQRLAVRIEAGKGRQQRGMDVEHLAVPTFDKGSREQPHEPCKTDQLDCMLVERGLQGRLECSTILAERLALDDERFDSGLSCPLEPESIRTIGN